MINFMEGNWNYFSIGVWKNWIKKDLKQQQQQQQQKKKKKNKKEGNRLELNSNLAIKEAKKKLWMNNCLGVYLAKQMMKYLNIKLRRKIKLKNKIVRSRR